MVTKKYTIRRLDDIRWEIPRVGGMRVPGLIFGDERTLPEIEKDQSADQVYNVAHLPGIVGRSMAMPDVHWGYGFPIGGVAAFDMDEGIVSPGGVGYDINCGVRLGVTNLYRETIAPEIRKIIDALFAQVPCGVGSRGGIKLNKKSMADVLKTGAAWAVKQGFGGEAELGMIENRGVIHDADPDATSERAFERGKDQLGTLGSGNHFLEIGFIDEIFDETVAIAWGLDLQRVTIMIHSGSRGFGYQVCDEFLARMVKTFHKEGIEVPDRQLACTKLKGPLGRQYLAAMAGAANFAFANRQILMHLIARAWQEAMNISPRELGMRLLYDVCHNMAKIETHTVNGKVMKLCVHRKGATRVLSEGHADLPPRYRSTGQPVLIPGDMGRASYILVGRQGAMDQTFGSACHGAGRLLSRSEAIKKTQGRSIDRELQARNIYPRWVGRKTLREECPEAYKDVTVVVDIVHRAGLAHKVARIRPLGVVKG